MNKRQLNWVEFCRWVQGKTISCDQPYDFVDAERGFVRIAFDDGSKAVVCSEQDEEWCIGPPIVRVEDAS